MANPLLVGVARSAAPTVIAGVVAAPVVGTLMLTATGCVCALMLVRHWTQSQVTVAARKGEGIAFKLEKEGGRSRD